MKNEPVGSGLWKAIALAVALALPVAAHAQADASIEARIVGRVRTQLLSDYAHWAPDSAMFETLTGSFSDVYVREVVSPWRGARLWKARPRVSHSHEYWVVSVGNVVYQLGGFSTVEATALLSEPTLRSTRLSVDSATRLWTQLLDPFGGMEVRPARLPNALPGGEDPSRPPDLQFGTRDGGHVVRRTTSSMWPDIVPRSVTVVLTLVFDAEGRLVTWSQVVDRPSGS